MKRKQATLMTALMFILIVGVSTAFAAIRSVTIRVKGMSCGGCATTVEKALKSTDGVEDALVNFKSGKAVIKYDDQKITVARLREIINSTGFSCETDGSPARGR